VTGQPEHASYDIVIIGGAIMGAATAWFLSDDPDFDGRVLVVEMDPSYALCSTAHTNSCMRQQFSAALNVQISQFGAKFVTDLADRMNEPEAPALTIRNFGYLYLADTEGFADALRAAHAVQVACGAGTRLMTPDQIAAQYPFYRLDDIVLGSHNTRDEGYFDGATVFDWWRRSAKRRGVEFVTGEVVAMTRNAQGTKVQSVTLKSGAVIACGKVVNASGPRAARTAAMAGIDLPVEPRKRFTWVFQAEKPLDRVLPLTIDPAGVHVRQEGSYYQVGGHSAHDPAVEYDDFEMDHALWADYIWPVLANRIPAFEAIKVVSEWAGHYAYNIFDQNAIIGPHGEVGNFYFLNGFSGHGLQQSPAMGRGMAELLTHGEYRSLDLSPFSVDRIMRNTPFTEKAVI
jgi:glycine/D-amino acid oxidase-like deaminating enzyme